MDDKPQVTGDEIIRRFKYRMPPPEKSGADEIRIEAQHLAFVIANQTRAGREQCIALTRLEESVDWAQKALHDRDRLPAPGAKPSVDVALDVSELGT